MKNNHYLSIIIVSYNVERELINCLTKIVNIKNKEIIIIDNNSQDKTIPSLNIRFSKNIKIVKNKYNIGFARAVNQGIKIAKGGIILLLNPDTIPNIKSIYKLKEMLINYNKSIGLIGGRLLKPNNKGVHGTYVNRPFFLTGLFEFTNLKKIFPDNKYSNDFYYKNHNVTKPKLVYGLSGGFLMFKKELIDRIGLLDENYFMYLEDVDFGIRARKSGYKNYYVPDAQIIHNSGSSSKNSQYKINVNAWRRSRNYFFRKHFSIIEGIILFILFTIDDFITDIFHIIKKQPLS